MASPVSLPLYEKIPRKNTLQRTSDIIIFFLLLSLLTYRLLHLKNHGTTWLLAFLCESWFTFTWVLVLNMKWNPVIFETHPDLLLQAREPDKLPSVDMFVTTVDPVLEPPIITVNTVLSLLAVDYPAHKLACYVSDDGCSPLSYYSLVEASKFAQLWVPFCRKYDIQVRAPFRYFSNDPVITLSDSTEFQHERKRMKEEYEQLCHKIEVAVQKSVPPCDVTGDFAEFSGVEHKNHPTIIKVLWENKEGLPDGLPHLVYISREKRHKHPHHYKAGAMNSLTRVSALMTNAPYMLNVDCDMFVNNPKAILHAMCVLLGSKSESEIAFAQFPQVFYDGLKDDPYGNQMVVLFEYIARGIAGLQGPFYGGTGCFHRRKIIYGLSPHNVASVLNGKLVEDIFSKIGNSKELTKSAIDALEGKTGTPPNQSLQSRIEAACKVADCGYEYGTSWGTKLGWIYGSTTEDIQTGLRIHKRGWRSAFCTPNPPAFLGCAPSGGPATMTQQKRWATGLLEILLSKGCPIFAFLFAKLQWRQCLAYLWLLTWGLRPVFELCYAALPAYCIIVDSHFLPKVQEPALYVPVALFLTYNIYTLSEYLRTGQSMRAWWNNQRMARVTTLAAWLFGFFRVMLKLFGLSETIFEVTQKEQSIDIGGDADDDDAGRFTFNESPIFVPGTTILLVHFTTLVVSLLKLQHPPANHHDMHGSGLGETFCSGWLVLLFWPFFKGLFRKGRHGIPKATIYKSATLAFLFLYWCRRTAMSG